MFPRFLRSLIALCTLIVAYQAYVLLAVPWLEPPLAARAGSSVTESERREAANSVTRHQRLLSHYFPAEHWSQLAPPIVLGHGPALLVLPGYTSGEGGQVEIEQFALLVFPTPLADGGTPPRDAIILEAPEGATLQFDKNLRLERGQFGQLQSGVFEGPITIRSDMHEPGTDDDLLVETSDLVMNTKLLYSAKPNSPVRFRLGESFGSGSELEIRLLEDQAATSSGGGPSIAGVDSLEIRRAVQLRVQLATDSLLPEAPRAPGSSEDAGSKKARPPVDVSCTGPFVFDFVRYVASFDQNVEVQQVEPGGQGDRLAADQLDIHFAAKEPDSGAALPLVDSARRQQRELTRLEPVRVVAQGRPVIVTSPAKKAEARGARMQLDLRERGVTLDGGDTTLVYGLNVLRAPTIDYWHPDVDAGTKIGRFRASGPGSLYYVLDPAKPDEAFQAAWQKSVALDRSDGEPVLTLDGRPQLSAANIGGIAADQLTVYFRELAGGAAPAGRVPLPASAKNSDVGKLPIAPVRLAALGRVEITSPGLAARTEELLAEFRPIDGPVLDAAGSAAGDRPGAGSLSTAGSSGPRKSTYHVEADRIQLGLHLHGQEVVPASVSCDGHVAFREIPLAPDAPPPLEIRGASLTASGLAADAARITMLGGAPGQPAGANFVQLSGRGMTFLTAAVEIDQRENRLWSDGPGQAQILITRDLDGRATATPYPFEIRWQNGMEFDGRLSRFRGNIFGQGPDDSLRCQELTARLAAPIEFGAPQVNIDPQAADVAEIEMIGQVVIDHHSRNEAGPVSHDRLQLARLSINQQTGAISGEGPGVIRSTRFVDKRDWSNLGGASGAGQDAEAGGGARLTFFRIDFDDRLAGNLYTHELAFNRRVRTVFGPVDSWEQELAATRPESLPPESAYLECDELRANEDPVTARAQRTDGLAANRLGPIQLRATGNVRIDGRSATQGQFHANAASAGYDQGKKLFTLSGDGRAPAELFWQDRPGGPYQHGFGNVQYWHDTGRSIITNAQGGQFTLPTTPGGAPGARGQR